MHSIDRNSLLIVFGDTSITPEYLQAHAAVRANHVKATQWISTVLGHIIEQLQCDDIPGPNAPKAAQRVKEVFVDLAKCGLSDLDAGHEQFLEFVAIRQQLAELKCQILEVETSLELAELQVSITQSTREQVVKDAISYLDPDNI